MILRKIARFLPWPQMLVFVTFVAMLFMSWRRWTSMIVDVGREADLPLRLMNGEVLYRDIHYLYPPFSPYFNSLIYRLFGPHLDTLAFSGIFFTGVLVFLCYKIGRKLMPATGAAIAASLIAVMSFKPAGSLVLSYSFAGLHGAVFALAAVLFAMRYAEKGKKADLLVGGCFIGLAAITKQEFGFAAAVPAAAYPLFRYRSGVTAAIPDIAFAAFPALAITVPVFGLLFTTIDWRILINDCHLFYTNIPESLEHYNRFRSGLDDPFGSFIQMLGAVALCVSFSTFIILVSDRKAWLRRRMTYFLAASFAVAVFVLVLYREQWDGSPLRALPFLLIAAVIVAWRRSRRDDPTFPENLLGTASPDLLFILVIFSLAIILRVILRVPSGGFSGSFYVPPSLLIIVYALVRELPAAVGRWTADEVSCRRARFITQAFCIIAIAGTMAPFAYRYSLRFRHKISAERGTLIAERNSGPAIDGALRFIEANTKENEVIAVVPEGNDLAFLTGRRINFRHQVLIPGFLSEGDETDAIQALKVGNVRYILITNRPMREFGKTAFGEDFYTTLGGYINENYETVAVFGKLNDPDPKIGHPQFFIKALKRRDLVKSGDDK